MSDPLDGLDAVEWSELGHAYGTAGDVPSLLRELRSADESERHGALGELYGNIFHQGSRYPASAPAVPFLLALAADPATPDRDAVVQLLSALAIGYDGGHLPGGVAVAEWRARVARLQATTAEAEKQRIDAWVAAAADARERRSRQFHRDGYDFAYERRMATAELAAYDAVRAGVPVLCGLLGDSDRWVRAAAAHALGWFPEEAAVTLPVLLERDEPNAVIAAGLVGDASIVPRIRPHLAAGEPVLRWAAAIALARVGTTGPEVIAELAAFAARPPEDSGVLFLDGDLRGLSATVLAELADPPPEAAAALLDGLSRTSETSSFTITAAALRMVFGPDARRPLPPHAELTDVQRRAVRTLADLDEETWRWLNFTEILDHWNLPSKRADLRGYAELD
ncbi:HEAT repeat domain-containing protein [Actinomadura craniellae]|uniref:HEAT repeat domain-containing protein n=1 Tax=Actinomadura craniellae TaxID=2231787 RepID=A0A365H9T5_9ACTN|nr:HEAT repeat domain-containing protein [Actinomadura craniellae]RAY15772.1 HEAT repeat domain-containing protein [Actinomadura craniellae]